MIDIAPEPAQFDEFGRPLHPLAAAIHNSSQINSSPVPSYSPIQGPAPTQQIPPVDTTPIPPTPTQQAIKDLHVPQHSDPNLQNSKLRTVLNAIAGGFAGAAGHPEMGSKLANAPYNRAMEDYKNKLAGLQTGSDVEQQGVLGAKEREILKTQRLGASSKADTAEEKKRHELETEDNARRQTENKIANEKSLEELRKTNEAKTKQLTDELLMKNEAIQKAVSTGDLSHIKPFYNPKESGEDKAKNAALIQEAKDKQALTPTGQAANASRSTARVVGAGTPAAIAATEASSGARTKGAEDVKLSPKNIEMQAELTRAKSLATLTANVKDTSHTAQIALQAFPDIRRQSVAASEGLFANRWKEFRTGTLGTEDSEKYAALRENVMMLQKAVAKVHVGARGTSAILSRFENMFNVSKMDRKTFLTSINETEKWLKRYAALPNSKGQIDLSDVDKQVNSNASGKYGVIEEVK